MNNLHPKVPVGECLVRVRTCNPAVTLAGSYFDYLDIASVDRVAKKVTAATKTAAAEAPSRARQIVHAGDVLVSTVRPNLNAVARVSDEFHAAIASTGFCVLRPRSDMLDSRYLFHWVKSEGFVKDMVARATGANYPAVSDKTVKTSLIPLPTLTEQQQIADTLDKADALRRKDQELLQKYDELAQSIFYEMFGDPEHNENDWSKQELRKLCSYITDGTHFSPPMVDTGYPYVTAKHLKNWGLDFYRNPTFVDEAHHRAIYSRCNPVKGDVLYIKDGATTGIAAVNEYDFEFSMLSSLALIKTDPKVLNNYYLVAWLNNPQIKEKYLREYMAGAAIKRFTLQKIKGFPVLVPPVEMQNDFAKQINGIQQLKSAATKNSELSEALFTSQLQHYF